MATRGTDTVGVLAVSALVSSGAAPTPALRPRLLGLTERENDRKRRADEAQPEASSCELRLRPPLEHHWCVHPVVTGVPDPLDALDQGYVDKPAQAIDTQKRPEAREYRSDLQLGGGAYKADPPRQDRRG